MNKYIVGLFVDAFLVVGGAVPAQAAALTTVQANSLIAVVQSAPGVPASVFVNLITAFSNITVNQATSLIAVVQSAPTAPANAFVNLLISFTQDTTTSQSVIPVVTQTTPTINPQSTVPATQPTAVTQPTNVPVQTQVPTITLFGAKDPNPTTGAVGISWRTSGPANIAIDMVCAPGSINFSTDKGNHPTCEKGGVWYPQGQTEGSILMTPSGNANPVAVTFSMTVLDQYGNYSNQKQTASVIFPAQFTGTPTVSVINPPSGSVLSSGQTYNITWGGFAATNATFSLGLGDVMGKGSSFVTGVPLSSYCGQKGSFFYSCSYPWTVSTFGNESNNLLINVWIDNGVFPYAQGTSGVFSVSAN